MTTNQVYLARHDQGAREKDAFRWEALIDLKDVVLEQAPEVPLTGRDRAMYESFFRSEPGKYMGKPRYMIAMRQVRLVAEE